MQKILKELNLPGNLTRSVIIPRNSNKTLSNNKTAVQLELPITVIKDKSSNKE